MRLNEQTEEIFNRALEIEDPEDRQAFIQQACGPDQALLGRLQRLVGLHGRAEQMFPTEPPRRPFDLRVATAEGSRIGSYHLLSVLGEGGFGTVYLAQQERPIKRQVALKVIKVGMDTRQVIARFEAERQALAFMNHRSIAKVLDAGTVGEAGSELADSQSQISTGRPYFVMELVQGVPISRFCEERQLPLRQRLDLFLEVCDAVQHAHQKGIIHRDLKPTNILVSADEAQDAENPGPRTAHPFGNGSGKATIKIIDFGIAKAIEGPLTDRTLLTQDRQFLGTPEYMSPEQAGMGQGDVDTRSDIYSLGVLLYEILTNGTPLDRAKLETASHEAICRRIREEEPARPSTRLRSKAIGGQAPQHSALANRQPQIPSIPADLDWIVMKALEKDRERRYPSAGALREDLERLLNHEPVTAVAPSVVYRSRRFVRRNRVAVAMAVVVSAGAFVSTWQAIRATHSQRLALSAQANAEAALKFVREDLLGQADPFLLDPNRPPNRDLRLITAIQSAAEGIEERYKDQPLVEAKIRLTIGNAFRHLGDRKAAENHVRAGFDLLERELGRDAMETLEAGLALSWVLQDQSQFKEAVQLSRDVLKTCRRELGLGHALTLQAMICLGNALVPSAGYREARSLFEEARKLARKLAPPNPHLTIDALSGLASVTYHEGDQEKAASLNHEIIEFARQSLGPDNPTTLRVEMVGVNDLGNKLMLPRAADALAQDTYARCVRILGEEHPMTLHLSSELGGLNRAKGLFNVSADRTRLQTFERVFGKESFDMRYEQMRLGNGLCRAAYFQEGEGNIQEGLNWIRREVGEECSQARWGMEWLAHAYILQGRFAEAEALRREVLEIDRRVLQADDPWLREHAVCLAYLYARQGKWQAAAPILREVVSHAHDIDFHHSEGILVAWLAKDMAALSEIVASALNEPARNSDRQAAYRLAQALVLVSETLTASDRGRTSRWIHETFNESSDSLQETLLRGMAAVALDGDLDSGVKALTPLVRNPDSAVACLAGFLLSDALHLQGQATAGSAWLAARGHLERAVRAGDLGNGGGYSRDEWFPWLASIVAGEQSERRIFSARKSSAIDAAYLSSAHEQWKPVKALLNQAGWLARRREWKQAKSMFLQGMTHEYFSWEAALQQDPRLPGQIAAIFAMTDDRMRYASLCEQLLSQAAPSQLGYAELAAFSADFPPIDLRDRIVAMKDWATGNTNPIPSVEDSFLWSQRKLGIMQSESRWGLFLLGVAAYRAGDFQTAADALNAAAGAFNIKLSGTAQAFAAMTSWKLNQTDKARRLLAAAEITFREFTEGTPAEIGPNWHQAVLFEMAMNEARSLIR